MELVWIRLHSEYGVIPDLESCDFEEIDKTPLVCYAEIPGNYLSLPVNEILTKIMYVIVPFALFTSGRFIHNGFLETDTRSQLQKLQREWIQALGAVISAIVWVGKR